jgi:hypothetical protein
MAAYDGDLDEKRCGANKELTLCGSEMMVTDGCFM